MTWPTMDRDALSTALASSGATITPGLTDEELAQVESCYGFHFAPDHRLMLSIGLPLESSPDPADRTRWPDWRNGDETALRKLVAMPVDGVLSHVEGRDFWWPEWGDRPAEPSAAVELARPRLTELPPLVPVHAYRFISSMPQLPGNPVFSIYGTDVIHIARDLLDYLRRELVDGHPGLPDSVRHIEFWSLLVERRALRSRDAHRNRPPP
jgi:hypothetical protein